MDNNKNSKNHIAVSLRFSILLIFIVLFVSAIISLVAFNYIHSSRILLNVATSLMQKSSTTVKEELFEQLNDVAELSQGTSQAIQQGVLNINTPQLIEYTTTIVKKSPIIDAAWLGDENGNILLAETEEDGSITTEIINRNVNPATHILMYRNLAGQVSKTVNSKDFNYDPRNIFWYKQAKQEKKLIWTDIYVINVLNRTHQHIAIIAASPVYKSNGKLLGVFGLDLTLDYLTRFIETQKVGKHGITFIVTNDGKLISLPGIKQRDSLIDIHSIDKPWIITSFDIYKKTNKTSFSFFYKNKKYLAAFTAIPHFINQGWMIGLVVPEDDFVGELKKASLINSILGLVILVIGIILISNLITRVVDPIKKLVDQTDKIKHFELDDEVHIQSRIREVNALSDSIFAMKLGLKSFQQYVPSTLVRQLIETGQNARIGGTKKTLTIFFSDIENFTTVAEKMDPNHLMEHICEYFDEMSKILLEEKCTIDKYIGDSVMGFWGAPLTIDLPCERAASAALRCMHKIKELNSIWRKNGKPELITRMGLHLGDAIVGNVGSAERLNYTAIGDAINVASRLEGLNVKYSTNIIVSQAVYDVIKDKFVLRKLDEVTVKGRTACDPVYELLAKNKDELSFDIDKYKIYFDKAFGLYKAQQWQEAVKTFELCIQVYPEDKLARMYIDRCKWMMA